MSIFSQMARMILIKFLQFMGISAKNKNIQAASVGAVGAQTVTQCVRALTCIISEKQSD
jgi:hypothetical protein